MSEFIGKRTECDEHGRGTIIGESKDNVIVLLDSNNAFQVLPKRELEAVSEAAQLLEARAIIKELLSIMDMQEKRMAGEFHLSAAAFLPIWDNAKSKGAAFLLSKA